MTERNPEIDWSMIDSRYSEPYIITISETERYKVEFKHDYDSSPDDSDCYEESDLEKWRNDQWYYIGVIVTPLHVPESVQFELSDSLWGLEFDFTMTNPVEYNGKTFRDTGEDYTLMVYPVPDMITEVQRGVARWKARTAIESYLYS